MRIVFYSLLMLIAVAPAGAQRPAEDAFSSARARQPKTVREFFNLLPQKYFMLEGCAAKPTKKNCDTVRAEYLKNYLEVEDIANGYMRGGCDGAQSCFHMALFRHPDGTYVVGLTTAFELGENSYFLESSVSAKIEPNPILNHPLPTRPCKLSGTYAPVSSGFPVTSRPAKMW